MWLCDQKLFQLKQLPNQTVEQYAAVLKELADKAQKTDREMLSFFINGLRPKIQAFVAGKAPADFDSAYGHAKTGEVVTRIPQSEGEESPENDIIGHLKGIEKELAELKLKTQEQERVQRYPPWQQTQYQQRSTPAPPTYGGRDVNGQVQCNKCFQIGHSAPSCPQNGRNYRIDTRECYNCGEKGHIARRCSKGHLNA